MADQVRRRRMKGKAGAYERGQFESPLHDCQTGRDDVSLTVQATRAQKYPS